MGLSLTHYSCEGWREREELICSSLYAPQIVNFNAISRSCGQDQKLETPITKANSSRRGVSPVTYRQVISADS
jgi:hypothetical protein